MTDLAREMTGTWPVVPSFTTATDQMPEPEIEIRK